MSIGSIDGDGPDAFGRVATVALTSDTVIVVTETMRQELRAFDFSGRHLWSAGRAGQGPGEFSDLSAAYVLPGDSILAISSRRASTFDAAGHFVSSVELEPLPQGFIGLSILGTSGASTLVGYGFEFPTVRDGYYRTNLTLAMYDRDGGRRADFAQLPHSEGHFTILDNNSYRSMLLPLGRATQFAVGPSGVAIGTQDRFEVLVYDTVGQLAKVLRVGVPPVVIGAAIRDRYTDDALARIDSSERRAEMSRILQAVEFPPTLPAFGRLYYDSSERLWVQEFVPPFEERSAGWWVFDVDGSFLAQVVAPKGFAPQHLTEKEAIGVFADEFGVHYVQVRTIEQ